MSNDALERLKKKSRPTVPERNTSLSPTSQDVSTSRYLDSKEQRSPEPPVSEPPEPNLSNVSEPIPKLKTKQTTLRMEAELSDRLHSVCREHGLSREVLIEAMFEYCEQHSDTLETVLSEADKKNEIRQQVANQRRAQSMMKRFSGQ